MLAAIDRLIARGEEVLKGPVVPIEFQGRPIPLANDLEHFPHAFVLACVMDRQMLAERAWLIPQRFAERLGNFEFSTLSALTLGDVRAVMTTPSPLHRFKDRMSVSFHKAVQRIANVYGGDASRIWTDRAPCYEVVTRFRQFHGVGPKLASMAVLILVREFKIPLPDLSTLDIAPDVHVRRVFFRLNLCREDAEPDEVAYRARSLYPQFPGILDLGAWEIGRAWCRPTNPRCKECIMEEVCPMASSHEAYSSQASTDYG